MLIGCLHNPIDCVNIKSEKYDFQENNLSPE